MRLQSGSFFAVLIACGAAALSAAPAEASPWTLGKGQFAMRFGVDAQIADQEWLIDGSYQAFPLDGRYFSVNGNIGVRYGILDWLEVGAALRLSYVSYTSDELLVQPENPDDSATILSFDREAGGPADANIYARLRFTPLGRVVAAVDLDFKFPTGYAAPRGTFVDGDPAKGLDDDVALGDGQLDITPLFKLGLVPVGSWFLRVDAGFRFRFFGLGQ